MDRSSLIRKMNGVEHAKGSMGYPYSYISRDEDGCNYALGDILRGIVVETEQAEAGDFPANIREHFWVRGGERDGDSWMACGQLTSGVFFFFAGGCDYTGFDCQGGMSLWISNSWKNIVEHAMSRTDYDLYSSQTEVPPAEGEVPWPVLTREEFWAGYIAEYLCSHCHERNATEEEGKLCRHCQMALEEDKWRASGSTTMVGY